MDGTRNIRVSILARTYMAVCRHLEFLQMDRKNNIINRLYNLVNIQNDVSHNYIAYMDWQLHISLYFNIAVSRHLEFLQTDRKNNISNRLSIPVNLRNDVLHKYMGHVV